MIRFAAALLLTGLVTPALGCTLPSALFVCGAPEGLDGALSLCGIDDDGIAPDTPVQFVDGTEGGTGAIYPDPPGPPQSFAFAHWWTEAGQYRMQVSWSDAGRRYRLFSEQGPGNAAEVVSEAGLIVMDETGAELARVQCGEAPHVYLHVMQQNMACDRENPYGEAACLERPAGPAPRD